MYDPEEFNSEERALIKRAKDLENEARSKRRARLDAHKAKLDADHRAMKRAEEMRVKMKDGIQLFKNDAFITSKLYNFTIEDVIISALMDHASITFKVQRLP